MKTMKQGTGQIVIDGGSVFRFPVLNGKAAQYISEDELLKKFIEWEKQYNSDGSVHDTRETTWFMHLFLVGEPSRNNLVKTSKITGETNKYFVKNGYTINLEKLQSVIATFQDYQNAVKNAQEKSGSEVGFTADSNFTTAVENSVAVKEAIVDGEHRDYIQYRYIKTINKTVFIDTRDNSDVTEYCSQFLKKHGESKKQSEAGILPEYQVKPRLAYIGNIYAVVFRGETWIIKH